jgi:putative endonuclease
MTALTSQRGIAAEQIAADYLRAQGLLLLARNLRCKSGELDLVCLDGTILVIVEVRQRGSAEFGGALASVTWHKQRKIVRATQYFLQRNAAWRALLLRFDVIAVEGLPAAEHRVVWVQDAFRVT